MTERLLTKALRLRGNGHDQDADAMFPLRRCRFRPYRKGYGPTFTLTLYPLTSGAWAGTYGADLRRHTFGTRGSELICRLEGFRPSPLHAEDSDETMLAVVDFMVYQDGERVAELEAVSMEATIRWGDD